MKKAYKSILTLFCLIALSACENFLDQEPVSQIGDNAFYTSDAEIEAAMVAVYDGLQAAVQREFALTEMRSDNARTKSSEGEWAQFETLNVDPTNSVVADYWQNFYNVIFRANTVLENLGAVSNEQLRARYDAEARFNRALSHFKLVKLFGDIPVIDRVIIQSDEEYFKRIPSDEVYTFIVNDLQASIPQLPARGDIAEGRATKGAARSLLAKVFLTMGNYAAARSLLEEVISGGHYDLVAAYRDVFYDELNEEIIFAIQYLNDDEGESQDFSLEFTALGRASGLNYPTDDLIGAFTPEDAERFAVSFDEDVTEAGKFITTSSDATLCGNDWIVLRYADVLLMHAEAILAENPTTTDPAALASFNKVRSRAGLTPVSEITRETLLYERRMEMAFENQRWFDLQRFGVAEPVLKEFAVSEGFTFESTDLLLPVPQREINVSKGLLEQNPGY